MNTLVVIVRYFGGIKLGVGGLIRAYSDSAKSVLELATIVRRVREIVVTLCYSHSLTGEVMRTVYRYRAQIIKIRYGEMPVAIVRLPATYANDFERDLRDATRGQVELFPTTL